MRTSQRDKRTIWYALYEDVVDVVDDDGNLTGEQTVQYSAPTMARMNVSGGKGKAEIEMFGVDNPFKITAVTDDLVTPFNDDTIFWFGIDPGKTYDEVPHNYRCTGISRTINQVVIALAGVDYTVEDNNDPVISG